MQATQRPWLVSQARRVGASAQSAAERHSGHAFSSGETKRALRSPVRQAFRHSSSPAAAQHAPSGPYVAAMTPRPSGVVLPTHARYAAQIARGELSASLPGVPPSPSPPPDDGHTPESSTHPATAPACPPVVHAAAETPVRPRRRSPRSARRGEAISTKSRLHLTRRNKSCRSTRTPAAIVGLGAGRWAGERSSAPSAR